MYVASRVTTDICDHEPRVNHMVNDHLSKSGNDRNVPIAQKQVGLSIFLISP